MKCANEIRPYIFISYAHKDVEIAKKITEFLQSNGFEVWIDYNNIRAGQQFNDKIADAIYNSSLFISLVSSTYIEKPFCGSEITYAHNNQKTCMPVYIEAVSPPRGSALDLMFLGTSLSGFNKDINNEEDFNELCRSIINSEYIESLKRYMGEGNDSPMPFVRPSIFDKLETFNKRIMFGNYFLSEIVMELFPPVFDGTKTETSSNNNTLLINKLIERPDSHFLITGDGGSGKTVALKSIFKSFIKDYVPVIYIPLNKIPFSERTNIFTYLEDELRLTWDSLKQYGRMEANNRPLRLLLDGFNEIQGDKKKVISDISSIMNWENTQVIITSRSNFRESLPQNLEITSLTLKPLNTEVVKSFLEKNEAYSNLSQKMLMLLSNPLMLMLYVNTDSAVMDMYNNLLKYSHYYKIKTTNDPSSEGQIIWNYLQSQLYRIDEGFSSQLVCDAYVIIEYLLPLLAHYMIKNNKTYISREEFSDLLSEVPERDDYKLYYNRRLSEDLEMELDMDFYQLSKVNLKKTLLNKMVFLVQSEDDGYEFFHQCFRDFFGAMFIAKKIESLAGGRNKDYSGIGEVKYNSEVLTYVSQVLTEEKAKPSRENGILSYPGKNGINTPSSFSDAEKALDVLRGEFNEQAQNAVCNLMKILSIARNKMLSNCDFSSLDLRKCNLKGCYYSEFNGDDLYPSSFEDSYIDLECFISPGHQASIQAICTNENGFFTADSDGCVKKWEFKSSKPVLTVDTDDDAIVSLAYSKQTKQLAILKKNKLYIYDTVENKLNLLASDRKIYKYIRFNEQNEVEVTYDVQPMLWFNLEGEEVERITKNDITSGCQATDPEKKEILVSYIFGILHKYILNEKGMELYKEINMKEITNGKRINDIKYSKDGSRFLVAFGNSVAEFDSVTMNKTRLLTFESSVNAVCYTDDKKIIVANGVNITVLKEDFSIEEEYHGEALPNILKLFLNEDKLYILDVTGTIKLFSSDIRVSRSRKLGFKPSSMAFGLDRPDSKEPKLFIITDNYNFSKNGEKCCVIYDFNHNHAFYPGKSYEIFNVFLDKNEMKHEYYKLANKIVAIDKETSENISYTNYKGITIFGCSFKNVKGSINDEEGKKLLIQNGGIINE